MQRSEWHGRSQGGSQLCDKDTGRKRCCQGSGGFDKEEHGMNGKRINEFFDSPYDYNTNQDLTSEKLLQSIGEPIGYSIQGNLGQTLVPDRNLPSGKKSVGKNVEVIINGKGNINHRTVGIAHEFGHVILYLGINHLDIGSRGLMSLYIVDQQ